MLVHYIVMKNPSFINLTFNELSKIINFLLYFMILLQIILNLIKIILLVFYFFVNFL